MTKNPFESLLIVQKKKKKKKTQLEMCPQYMDAPTLGTSIKACKTLPNQLTSMWGHLCTQDILLVDKESKNNEKYKAICLQGQ